MLFFLYQADNGVFIIYVQPLIFCKSESIPVSSRLTDSFHIFRQKYQYND